MKAEELNGTHLGHRITVKSGDNSVTGVLYRVEHAASLVSDTALGRVEESYSVGRQYVILGFTPDGHSVVPPDAEVVLP